MILKSGQGSTDSQLWKDVLVIDADPKTADIVKNALPNREAAVRVAETTDRAAIEMKRKPADLIVVNLELNDNNGLELLTRLRKRHPATDVLAVSPSLSANVAIAAWRAGAADILVQPVDVKAVRASFKRLAENRRAEDRVLARNAKLRVVCRKLNKARHEISQQVNMLCNDLVKAYQELAQQLNETQTSGEFTTYLGQEVEIEAILRRTLEWILDKIGPLNAAIFLPDSEGELSLGAYLNFDTEAQTPLVDAIAQTIAKTALTATSPIILESDDQLNKLFGNESTILHGRQWLAAPAHFDKECLAVVCIFRNQAEPADEKMIQLLESVCPVLAERIGRAIRIYQRGLQFDEE